MFKDNLKSNKGVTLRSFLILAIIILVFQAITINEIFSNNVKIVRIRPKAETYKENEIKSI